jgi:SAM-dependent methyltransferase
MEIHEWNQRYRLREHEASDFQSSPTPLLVETAKSLTPGMALDLASGAGRNALWLAEHGWQVTAVDGASVAVESLRARAAELNLPVAAYVADLEKSEYEIESSRWDLIAILYYLQRDLFEPAKKGVKPGGILIAIVHISGPGQEQTRHSLRPGELEGFFKGWEILHLSEGMPNDKPHRRPVAEIVARRPT